AFRLHGCNPFVRTKLRFPMRRLRARIRMRWLHNEPATRSIRPGRRILKIAPLGVMKQARRAAPSPDRFREEFHKSIHAQLATPPDCRDTGVSMRILQLAPLWESVPPPAYGGTEAVVHLLTEELVRMGHDVTLVASGDSLTAARLAPVFPRSLRRADDLADRNPYDWAHIAHAIDLSRCGFDVVHNHAGELAMAMAPLAGAPMLTTTHCLTTADTRFIWRRYRGAYNTISRSQRAHFDQVGTGARFMGHVYNAIDVASYPFQREKGEDL